MMTIKEVARTSIMGLLRNRKSLVDFLQNQLQTKTPKGCVEEIGFSDRKLANHLLQGVLKNACP